LDDRNPITDRATDQEVGDPQPHEIAASEFAVNREVEEAEITGVARKFDASTYRPDLLRPKRALLADESALVPWDRPGRRYGKVEIGHVEASIRPSLPMHRNRVGRLILSHSPNDRFSKAPSATRCRVSEVSFEPEVVAHA